MDALEVVMAYPPPLGRDIQPPMVLLIRPHCAFSGAPTLSHRCGYESAGSCDRVYSGVYFYVFLPGFPRSWSAYCCCPLRVSPCRAAFGRGGVPALATAGRE